MPPDPPEKPAAQHRRVPRHEDRRGSRARRDEHASTWFLRVLGGACRAHGLQVDEVLRAARLSPELLAQRDARVLLRDARAAWDAAARLSDDPDFGLHAAERAPQGSYDVLDYLGRSVATFGEMLARVTQLASVFTEDGAIGLERKGATAVLRHRARAPRRQVSELLLAAIVLRGRDLTGVALEPRRVGFMHAAPADAREHARIFGCKVVFSQPSDELVLDAALLALPLRTYEAGLSEILDDYARLVTPRKAAAPDVLTELGDAIADALPRGEPRLEDLARALKITPRTLQRRLRDAGTTYHAVLDARRHELALALLEDASLPMSKVALQLGFSEPSAFYRAFRRWTGKSPADLRRG